MSAPITFDEARQAAERIRPFLPPSPLRSYPALDATIGGGVRLWVKHENLNPTGAFKVRNTLAVLTALDERARRRGVVAATRGNHGLGLAWAGARLGVAVTVCVPVGNNPEKNEAMRAAGATLVEAGRDYDEAVVEADRLVKERGLTLVHATNNTQVIAGAATMTLEMLEERPSLEAIVIGIGGGSQAVGAMVVGRALQPRLRVYGVQAQGASAIHDSWHAGRPLPGTSAETLADGLATRGVYEMTFPSLRQGLAGFVAVSDAELAEAMRILMRTTHTLVEGAGAAGLAGVRRLRDELAGREVAVVLSGANVDQETLRRVVSREV